MLLSPPIHLSPSSHTLIQYLPGRARSEALLLSRRVISILHVPYSVRDHFPSPGHTISPSIFSLPDILSISRNRLPVPLIRLEEHHQGEFVPLCASVHHPCSWQLSILLYFPLVSSLPIVRISAHYQALEERVLSHLRVYAASRLLRLLTHS